MTGFIWEGGSYTFGDYVDKKEWDIDAKSLNVFVDIEKLTETLLTLRDRKETELSEKEQLAIKLFFEKVVDKQDKREVTR